jgi:two-component sensor histidine kinase
MNELVTNSLQHAFPSGQPGVVAISLRQNGDHTLALSVRDDGVGLPPDVNFETSDSLGLELVRTLTSQLDGSVQLDQTQGTIFTVVFPQPNLA